MNYLEFLKTKIEIAKDTGFEVPPETVNTGLKPHQRDAVIWALRGGRRALFESFGLGKTVQEIEFCHLAAGHEGGQALIVLPLGVKQEFTRDAVEVLGYEKPVYCRTMEEVKACDAEIILTNYERVRDGDIDPTYFAATSLDEASVLRSFGSKTYQTFLDKFKGIPYKLVATATPSPNKYKELIHYAGYLEVMDTGQALTRFFQRDSTKANNLTLYPNMEDEFWLWVSSWALFITKPSDLNPAYSDEGYVLPPLEVRWHEIPVKYGDSQEKDGQMTLFTNAAAGLKQAAEVKRDSIKERVAKMKEIVDASPEDHFVIWHDQEAERHEIRRILPETVDIYGSQDYDLREQRVIDFSEGRTRLFATKKSLSGSGCNFQRYCHREIFVGIDYEFNDFIQAIHRCYRFLQKEPVIIDIIYMENEKEIREALLEKWKNHDRMVEKMVEIAARIGIEYLTVYGFSTENWSRSVEEVGALMQLFRYYMVRLLKIAKQNNVRVKMIGDKSRFDQDIIDGIDRLVRETQDNTGLTFVIAVNYGGRDEITRAAARLARDCRDGKIDGESISQEVFASYLDTAGMPDPDLLIRTSGELRLSNYLLWQVAYTEFYITDCLWPDFNQEELEKAIVQYNKRERRFGGVKA